MSWPRYSKEEQNAVLEVLASGKVNAWTGQHCVAFEHEFASWAGCAHAVALANGTVALELAMRALGIGEGDEVIVTPRTFIASVSSIINVGAIPVFADVDRDSQNITAASVIAVLGRKTRAIMCVHLAGWPVEMDDILDIARQNNLYVLEDCAQAHGAMYKGKSAGTLGDVGAWSFCQDKIMTTGGEGGMVTTGSGKLYEFMRSYKDHGKSWQAIESSKDSGPGFKWIHNSIGTNFRMTEMQAAIGRIQINKMHEWHRSREHNASRILQAATAAGIFRVPVVPDYIQHAWYKCYIFLEPEQVKPEWSRDKIVVEINNRGVPCYTGTCSEVYLEKAFDSTGIRPQKRLQTAAELGETSIMLLVHPTLGPAEIDLTCSVIEEIGRKAKR